MLANLFTSTAYSASTMGDAYSDYKKITLRDFRINGINYVGGSFKIVASIVEVYKCKLKANVGNLCLTIGYGNAVDGVIIDKNLLTERSAEELKEKMSVLQFAGSVQIQEAQVNGKLTKIPTFRVHNFVKLNRFQRAAQPPYPQWKYLESTRSATYNIEESIIDIDSDGFSFWLMIDYKLPQIADNKSAYNSKVQSVHYTCSKLTSKILSFALYSSGRGQGNLIMEQDIESGTEETDISKNLIDLFVIRKLLPYCK
jgi:hypothetical protein